MIDVTISPDRIPAGTPVDLQVRLTNRGPGTYRKVAFTLRLPAGLVRLGGTDRIERSTLNPGESFSSPLRVKASAAGRYQLTSPSFSYRDHLGQPQYVTGFTAEISVDPAQPPPVPVPPPVAELITALLPLGQWSILHGRVTNGGEADLTDLEVSLAGPAIITERGTRWLVGRLPAGDSADVTFHVCAREAGAYVPVHLGLTYRGPDGSHRDETTHTIQVAGERVASQQPAKILFLGANPAGTSWLRIDQEIREIHQELQLGKERDSFRLKNRWAVRARDISRALIEIRPNFVHFAGHGGGGEESFAAEDETGRPAVIPVAGLADLFKVFKADMRCVVVNACNTERLARGLKSVLPDARVIGMRQPVGDHSAIRFSIGFYQAIGEGMTIEQAYDLGIAQMKMAPGGDDADAPLFL